VDWSAYLTSTLPTTINKADAVQMDLARTLGAAMKVIERVLQAANQRIAAARDEQHALGNNPETATRRSWLEQLINREMEAQREIDSLCDALSRSLDALDAY